MYHFVSIVDSESEEKTVALKKSVEKFGYDLTLLTNYDKSIGNYSKVVKVSDWMQSQNFSDDDIIFSVDAFDCVLVNYPDKTLEYLNKIDSDILISSEPGYNRWAKITNESISILEKYAKSKSIDFRIICAGAVCGRANKMKEFYLDMVNKMDEIKEEILENKPFRLGTENEYMDLFGIPPWLKTSDQFFMSHYLYKIDFVNYKKIKINLDFEDKILFNYNREPENFNLSDYVIVHVFALSNPEQTKRWEKVKKLLFHT